MVVNPEGHLVTVSVPQLEDAGPAAPEAKPPPPPLPPPEVKPPPPPGPPEIKPPPPIPVSEVDTGRGPRAGGIVLTVLGAGGLAAAAGFTVVAVQKLNSSNSQGCNKTTNLCTTQAGYNLRNDARTFGNVATGAWVGGGVLAAGGVALLVVGAVLKGKPAEAAVTPMLSIDPRGGVNVVAGGRF